MQMQEMTEGAEESAQREGGARAEKVRVEAAGRAQGQEAVPPRAVALPDEFVTDGSAVIATEAVERCPMCGGASFAAYASGFDYELRTCANLWTFVECGACSHVWLNPRPAVSTLGTIYPPHYYAYSYAKNVPGLALKAKGWLDKRKFRGIVSSLGRPAGAYIDVGCGDGRYLRLMREMGVPDGANFGLELDDRVVGELRQQGFAAFNQRAEACEEIAPGSIDLATMFHVIEHVDDPQRVCDRVATWLSAGGVFAVETPNIDSLDRRMFARSYWGGYHIPRHWNMFRAETLRRMLERAGLEFVDVRYQTGHSFWMYSLHHAARYHKGSRPGLSRFFDPFGGVIALPALMAITAFDKARALVGCRTSSMLMLARKRG